MYACLHMIHCYLNTTLIMLSFSFLVAINKTVELNIDVGDCNATYSSEVCIEKKNGCNEKCTYTACCI